MMSVPLKAQLNYLRNSMFAMDLLDEQFTKLQMLEDDNCGLLVEVISAFCDQPWLSQLSVLSFIPALLEIRREFDELHMRLKTMLQLEQQIQALDAMAPSR